MALERRNPLPVGRYWVDVPEGDLATFRTWLEERPVQIQVEQTTEREGALGSPNTYWYLFKVVQPVPWFGPGTPTIAGDNVHSIEDTVQRPDPVKDPLDQLLDWVYGPDGQGGGVLSAIPAAMRKTALVGLGAAGVGVVGYGAWLLLKGKRRGRARR